MSAFSTNCSILVMLTQRCIIELQSGQIPLTFTTLALRGRCSTIPAAGNCGERHRTQYICPGKQGCFFLARRF
jgi:hypothetical protein